MSANDALLCGMLELAVPIRIAELRDAGGPTDQDRAWLREFGDRLSSNGDALLYRVTSRKDRARRTDTASMAADLVRALAILSFYPGGVRFEGVRYFGWPEDRADWLAITTEEGVRHVG